MALTPEDRARMTTTLSPLQSAAAQACTLACRQYRPTLPTRIESGRHAPHDPIHAPTHGIDSLPC